LQHYLLLDANVLVAYYCKDEAGPVQDRARSLFAARAKGKIFLFVPNFCVVEAIRAFAKKSWSEQKYGRGSDASEAFEQHKKAFLDDIVDAKLLYSYELSRRHVLSSHRVYERAAMLSYRKGNPPSALDVLIIAMGCDLERIHGREKFAMVTADGPIFDVCEDDKSLPRTLNIARHEIPRSITG